GRSVGWGTIINSTYNEKKYLTSKYQGADSSKILHDAYVKALTNIRFLNNPNIFSSWLGIIIASMTAEELIKKNLANFSKVDAYADETWYADILNNNTNTVSENLTLSDDEIKSFSNKIINALSTEQKLCILFRYYEGFTVKEISKALRCSETAVISFLNAGIKKLTDNAEEIKKSSKQLAEFSNPIQLLLILMKAEYNSIPFETAPDKIFNSIIEDTAAVIAEKTVVAEKEAEKELEDEDEDEKEERKAGILSGNKKIIVIVAIIIAITAGLTIHFVNNGKSPAEPVNNTDKPSESETVSETKPTMDMTSESSTEDNSSSTSEESSSSTNPVTSQRTQSNNNNNNNN
ncbi:MAG: sigma-70 family RNA polymerase sigma factor, partial [Eubacterium sp.]|nr:sigma-70 family RNA polymerase sigma factor [Eubacterium sp.]